MEYIQLTMEGLLQEEQGIKEELSGIARSFIRTGWHLARIDHSQAYKLKGFGSIAEYAKATFGLDASTVSRSMEVYERYSIPGDTPELREEYKDFKFTKLVEMIQLPDEDHAMIRPETKRDDIRELAKFNKEQESSPGNLLGWQQEPRDSLEEAVEEFFRKRKDSLNALYSSQEYAANDIKGMAAVVRKGKSTVKTDKVFVVMYEDNLFIKSGNRKVPYDISWEEFFDVTRRIFDGAAAGEETYENYFNSESQKTAQEAEILPASENAKAENVFLQDQKIDKKEEKCQKIALNKPGMQESTPEGSEQKPNTSEETDQTEAEGDQIPGQDEIMNHPEYLPPAEKPKEGPLHGKRFANCIYYRDEGCISPECDGCEKKKNWKKQQQGEQRQQGELVETGQEESRKLLGRFTREGKEGYGALWAEAVKAYLATGYKKPETCSRFTSVGKEYAAVKRDGFTIFYCENGARFEVETERLDAEYAFYFPDRIEIAPTQNQEGAAKPQQDPEDRHGEMAVPEEWPEDLADIPVPSLVMIEDILQDQERVLKEYLACEGLPEKTVLKEQLITGGLRIIRNLVEDIQDAGEEGNNGKDR